MAGERCRRQPDPPAQMRQPAGSGERMEQQMPKKRRRPSVFMITAFLFCIIFLTAFGLVMIYSASSLFSAAEQGI